MYAIAISQNVKKKAHNMIKAPKSLMVELRSQSMSDCVPTRPQNQQMS